MDGPDAGAGVTVDADPTDGPESSRLPLPAPEERKPFLGGFRHRKTGVEYHHACTQTWVPPPASTQERPLKFHRDTQTVKISSCTIQSTREAGAQTIRPGLFIDERSDRELVARPYFDAAAMLKLREQKALIIQRYARGWAARRMARAMREEMEQQRAAHAARELDRKAQEEAHRAAERARRMNPRTKEDFDILHRELEAWRVQETRRIHNSGLSEAEQHEALRELLHRETRFLQTIDRLKSGAAVVNKDERITRQLEVVRSRIRAAADRSPGRSIAGGLTGRVRPQMAAPKRWQMADGPIDVHTPYTTRARELLELYQGLRMAGLSIDERLDVLLHVKWTVKEFDCSLTRELVSLIDREADLLNRGRSESALSALHTLHWSGLRQRIATLFLQFVQTPEFNPEALRFQKVPRELLRRPEIEPIAPRGESRTTAATAAQM